MDSHYSYKDVYGGIILTSPEGESKFLHGDDAINFLFEIEKLKELWKNGNPNTGVFINYDDHLDNLSKIHFFSFSLG